MARSIEEIYADILAKKEADPNLDVLSSTSKTAVWRLWLFVVAFASWVLETLFDAHKLEVTEIIATKRAHGKNWYKTKALAFQYGFDLIPDTDIFINDGFTEEQIEASKIIKYAAVTEASDKSLLIIKVATENSDGELSKIQEPEEIAFTEYIDEIADSGVPYNIINYLADILQLKIDIYYDALVLNSDGIAITGANAGKKPVEIALKQFLKELPFDGSFVIDSLRRKLRLVEGVIIPEVVSAASKWIDEGGYANFENISVKKIPTSGYFRIIGYTTDEVDGTELSRIRYYAA